MRVKFLQTADPVQYRPMLDISSRSTRKFCEINRYEYEAFVGLKRGSEPWHAMFNRIDMLYEHVESGFRGWLVYLDADAFVNDLTFDLSGYLEQHRASGLILRAVFDDKAPTWDVNSGVLLFNTTHPTGLFLIKRWRCLLDSRIMSALLRLPPAKNPINDQMMLQYLLWRHRGLWPTIHFAHSSLLNSPSARFIAQILRADRKKFAARLRAIRERVDRALAAYEMSIERDHPR